MDACTLPIYTKYSLNKAEENKKITENAPFLIRIIIYIYLYMHIECIYIYMFGQPFKSSKHVDEYISIYTLYTVHLRIYTHLRIYI